MRRLRTPIARTAIGAASAAARRARTRNSSSTEAGSAAGGAREEDDAVGVRRDLPVALHEHGLADAGAGLGGGDGRPHPLVELAAELLDQALLVLAHARIALGEEDLPMTRLHAQELDV